MRPSSLPVSRRRFLATGTALAAAVPVARADEPARSAETLAQALHATLTPAR